ncbi:MAG: helix-hairpin-helix domain-containing protein, partial [Ruminococcus sp.]
KKKLSPEKLIVIVGIIFATVLVLVNVFFDFVPHTVKTENIKSAINEFSTYYNQNVNKKKYTTTQKVIVNINTASVQELCTIRMIGETKAKAIVNYREKYGAFKDKGDIVKVYGIGEKTYEKIKDSICVN